MLQETGWPELPLAAWRESCETLHLWTQIVGKVRTALSPRVNHWWNSALYVSARGLTTSPIPWKGGAFEAEFDFLDHQLALRGSAGRRQYIPLYPRSVAEFHREFFAVLQTWGIEVSIAAGPSEIADPIPFAEDRAHAAYDPDYVNRFHRVLVSCAAVLQEFRARFIGKASPVHFFWGSFDLAATRFCGRRAPERPGADAITREAYSHECSSAGFWPGGSGVADAAFYAYAVPAPEGYGQQIVRPAEAYFHQGLGEFILMYDVVRRAASPRAMLLEFLQSSYEAGANLAGWDRAALERPEEAAAGPQVRRTA